MNKKYEQCQQELDQFLVKNSYKLTASEYWSSEFVNELFGKYRILADAFWSEGEFENAKNIIRSAEFMFVDIPMSSNYVIQEEIYDTLTDDVASWMSSHDMESEITDLFEAAILSAKTSFAHHPDNTGIRRLKYALVDRYDESGDSKKKRALLKDLFEAAWDGCLNDIPSLGTLCPNDLSFTKPYYYEYLRVLNEDNDIAEAVRVIDKWVFLCDRFFVDDKDMGQAYDYYDDAYNDLASLYDGTDSLIKALKMDGSPFLNDPYIMIAKDNHHFGYMDNDGHIVVPCIFRCAWKATSKDILSVMTNEKRWVYISPQGRPIFQDLTFDYAYPPFDGFILCGYHGQPLFGNLNVGTSIPIDLDFDVNGFISNGLLRIRFECPADDMSFEDEDNNNADDGVVNIFCMNFKRFENFLCKDGHSLLLPEETEKVKTPNNGVIMAGHYDKDGDLLYGLYDLSGDVIVPKGKYSAMLSFGENALTPVRRNGLCGFINRAGAEIIQPRYYDARRFSGGLAAVCDHDKLWGFINEHGEEIIPCQYASVGDFMDGAAWVCTPNQSGVFVSKTTRFGYIRQDGSQLTAPIFEYAGGFYKQFANVRKDKVWCRIDTDGNCV